MKNNNLVVCASTWLSFIASLKANLKLGYGVCDKTAFKNGFYTAVLQKGTDRAYMSRLAEMTGEEKENTLDLTDYLMSGDVYNLDDIVKETTPVQVIETSIKRTRKPRGKK